MPSSKAQAVVESKQHDHDVEGHVSVIRDYVLVQMAVIFF